MKRLLSVIWCLVCCLAFARAQYYYSTPEGGSWNNTQYNTTEGTDFWATYMFNYGNLQQDVNLKLYLYAVARKKTSFRIQYADGSYSKDIEVPANGRSEIFTVDQSKAYITDPDLVMSKGMHILSNDPISLYALNQNAEAGSYDATNVLPTKTLGREYVIQTYSTDGVATEFSILGTQNYTYVTIEYYEKNVETGEVTKGTVDLMLDKGETYLHRSSGIEYSLTGTTVCSSKPIAIFCGGQHADIPRGSSNKNHIYSQLYPATMWGKHFVVQNVHEHKKDFYRVTSAQNGTQVKVNGTLVATLNANETYDGIIHSPTHVNKADYIETSKNALVCFYATDGVLSNDTIENPSNPSRPFITPYEGAPAMAPVVPLELGCKDLIFATLNSSGISRHYANVVTYKSHKNGMRLDGANISAQFSDIAGTPYSYAQIELQDGAHTLRNDLGQRNADAVFSTMVYGLGMNSMGRQESYAYSPGSRILREVDMLINNEYIKEKSICITQPLSFTGLIGGDYYNYTWDFSDYGGTTTGEKSLNPSHLFSSAGDYDVTLIVGRQYPINCTNTSGTIVYDTVHAMIHVKDKYLVNFHEKICEGQTVELTGHDENGNLQTYTYSKNTHETKHFYTVEGCDSIVDVLIEVGKPESREIKETKCNEYTWHGERYTESGTHTWHGETEYGCDLTETLILTILKPVTGPTVEKTLCRSSLPYNWNGQAINKEGTYTATLQAANGCDSIATIKVKIEDEYREEITEKVCYGGSYMWRGKQRTEAKTYEEKVPSANGCDSTFILHLSFYPDYSNIKITAETCADKPYRFGDELLKTSGTYTKSFKTAAGCDSTVILTLTVWPLEFDTIYETICRGSSYYFDGRWLTGSGKYIKTESNEHKCTKTTVLFLTVNEPTHKYDTIRICEKALPYTYAGKYVAEKEGNYQQTLDIKNQAGCDSIYHLHLIVDKAMLTPFNIHRCDYEGAYNHPDPRNENLQNLTKTGIYRDTMQAVNGCDSIIEIRLQMGSRTFYDMPVKLCDNELPWRDPNRSGLLLRRDTTYNDTILNKSGCDSVITVRFMVNKTYNETVEVVICDKEAPYNHPDKRFDRFQNLSRSQTLTQTVKTVAGCDSTVTLKLTVNPTTYNRMTLRLCEEAIPYSYGENGKQAFTEGEYRDTLKTKNQYGCDSILIINLSIMSTIIDQQEVVLCDDELPYNHHDLRAVKLQGLQRTGTYRDTLKTAAGCDSIIELHLQVWDTYDVTERQYICDYEEFDFHGHIYRNMPARNEPYRLDTTFRSIHGCDSVVHLYLTVFPSYKIPTDTKTVCQNKEQPEWEWRDDDGTLHGIISIAEPRELFVADTLKTTHGCDSIFGIQLRIIPSYREDSLYTICQNERITWQGRSYCGNRAEARTGDLVLSPGLHFDTTRYKTTEDCDSIFCLQLQVYEIYEKDVSLTVCDNEEFVFDLSDTQGTVIQNEAPFAPTPSEEGITKETRYIDQDFTLRTVHGCDSVIHMHLTVLPSYEFVTRAKVCSTEDYMWRGKMFYETGIYYDPLPSKDQCDSVYVLELYKKPLVIIPMYDTICDNETYEHYDTLWYTNGSHTLVETMVWTPGMPIPQTYSDVTFRSKEDGCDSIVYRYWLNINKTFNYHDTAVICSNETYESEQHTYTGTEFEFNTGTTIAPFDTILQNIYRSVNGCDSIYHLHATVYPAYRHRDTIAICDNETAVWRGHRYAGYRSGNNVEDGLPAGEHVFRDSFLTYNKGCDSIYELHLLIHATYLFTDSIKKCVDEDFVWRARNLDHIAVGQYYFSDSLSVVANGCDSIYQLYLSVRDTTSERSDNVICRGDTLFIGTHTYTQPGTYHDTLLNEWGCNHYLTTRLEVIEPTIPTAWIDSLCLDDKAFEVFYTYSGQDPVAYSLYFDSLGHEMGFEDIINQPIEMPLTDTMELTLPMPWRNDDYHNYPRPDHYGLRLVLDNGVCSRPMDCCHSDTSLILNYPSWVTEQRFRDVIAILSTNYNGGYTFSAYQWYRNDQPIPGETLPYLYLPRELDVDTTEYYVRLTREGETESFQTCPIRIYDDMGTDTIAPYMGYLSVVPTCVSHKNPVVSILSRHEGQYRIYYIDGRHSMKEGNFFPDVTEVRLDRLPAGWYIIQLWSDATPEEPFRSIPIWITDGDRVW